MRMLGAVRRAEAASTLFNRVRSKIDWGSPNWAIKRNEDAHSSGNTFYGIGEIIKWACRQ